MFSNIFFKIFVVYFFLILSFFVFYNFSFGGHLILGLCSLHVIILMYIIRKDKAIEILTSTFRFDFKDEVGVSSYLNFVFKFSCLILGPCVLFSFLSFILGLDVVLDGIVFLLGILIWAFVVYLFPIRYKKSKL